MTNKCLLICISVENAPYETLIYGLYYFAKGGKIDQGKSEVVDKNDYYATG